MKTVRKALRCQRKGKEALDQYLIMPHHEIVKLYDEVRKAIIRGRDYHWFGYFSVVKSYDIEALKELKSTLADLIHSNNMFMLTQIKENLDNIFPVVEKAILEEKDFLEILEIVKLKTSLKMAYDAAVEYGSSPLL